MLELFHTCYVNCTPMFLCEVYTLSYYVNSTLTGLLIMSILHLPGITQLCENDQRLTRHAQTGREMYDAAVVLPTCSILSATPIHTGMYPDMEPYQRGVITGNLNKGAEIEHRKLNVPHH